MLPISRTTLAIALTAAAAAMPARVIFGQARAPASPARAPAAQSAPAQGTSREPPNEPATLSVADGRLTLSYDGRAILEGTIGGEGVTAELRRLVDSADGKVTQVLKWTARGRGRLALVATLVPDTADQ